MKYIIILTSLLLISLSSCKDSSDFPTKTGGAQGTLPNGIKYYALQTPWIKGKAALGVVVNTGHLNETQDEIGSAHFLEHVCFASIPGCNGKDPKIDIAQRGGLGLGKDFAAFCGKYTTTYLFSYPESDTETQEATAKLMGGIISGLEFSEEKIEIEKQIILKEIELSYSNRPAGYLSGGYFENHTNLGDSSQVVSMTKEKLDGFYRKWYRPDNIALVMLGSEPVDQIEKRLISAFKDVECVVDSALPPVFLPEHENNLDLYTPRSGRGNKIRSRLAYHYTRPDVRYSDSIRYALAQEMTCNLLKGMLERNKDIKVNVGSGSSSSAIILVESADSTDFRSKLELIGNAISHLKYKGAEPEFIQTVWEDYGSSYQLKLGMEHALDPHRILNNVFWYFSDKLPYTDEELFVEVVNNEGPTITTEEIKAAAQLVFNGTLSFTAQFPDYGEDWQNEMQNLLKTSANRPDVRVEQYVPQKMLVRRSSSNPEEQEMLAIAKPEFSPSFIEDHKILANGTEDYLLKNGMRIVWLKNSLENELLLKVENGIQNIPANQRAFMRSNRNVSVSEAGGQDAKVIEKQLRAWGINGVELKLNERDITTTIKWKASNAEFLWQYLHGIYKEFAISEYDFNKYGTQKEKNSYDRTVQYFHWMTGREKLPESNLKSGKSLTKNEVEGVLNNLINPAKTTLYLQGNTDVESLIAWLGSLTPKNHQGAEKGMSWMPDSDMYFQSNDIRTKTWMVNRVYKLHLADWSLKDYLLSGMFEEYMNRQLFEVIREEKGLVYSWGSSFHCGPLPAAYTATSLRYKIVPELLEESLAVLDQICKDVTTYGIAASELKGLKNREWNRYLDSWNNDKERLSFMAYQMECSNTIWSDAEVTKAIEGISLDELNQFVKAMLSQPQVTMVY
ncbi:MAG: insulinase family protein [Bacteroidales bacterium]|nr:insulinase family protein [Bacteroidales bacterium]